MAAGDCWSAGVFARFVSGGGVPASELVGSGGEVATPTLRDTMKKTGASTSAATERRRLVAVPLRIRRNDTIAGIIAMKHSTAPNAAEAGITANSAPRTATTNVTAPRPLRGDGDWSAFIGCVPFSLLPDPLSTMCDPVLQRRVEDRRSSEGDTSLSRWQPAAFDPATRTAIRDRVVARGGVTYPINTVEMSPADWRTHFGSRWHAVSQARFRPAADPHPQRRHRQHATRPVTNDLARRRVEC
jgi:hypothetical protein